MKKIEIGKQFKFLILSTIYNNEEYQKNGVMAEDLVFDLRENREKWLRVGQVRDDKEFKTSIEGMLSSLNLKDNYLNCPKKGVYFRGLKFDEGIKKIAHEIYTDLELEVDFDGINYEEHQRITLDKELLLEKIDNWTLPLIALNKEDDFLTNEQIKELAKLSIKLGFSSEI